MKTPSFFELQTIVENVNEELAQAQLQEVTATDEGVVLGFYRFTREPRMKYLVFDLDRPFPFLALLEFNPWLKFKKTKPVSLFLNARAKNLYFVRAEIKSDLGRVVHFELAAGENKALIEFRAIPKQVNFIVKNAGNTISWSPVKDLGTHDISYNNSDDEEVRSVTYLTHQWKIRRAMFTDRQDSNKPTLSPFERWIKARHKDRDKKIKALDSVAEQIKKFRNEEWAEVGEQLKNYGMKNLKPEWTPYIDFEASVSQNIQRCFEKAKAAKNKIAGAEQRLKILQTEIEDLNDVSEAKFEAVQSQILLKNKQKKAVDRDVSGRLRKLDLSDSGVTAYMGKSAADNLSLLRSAKPHDIWLHLKDYPSAHAVIHRRKEQNLADKVIIQVGKWLVQEGLSKNQNVSGGKYAVVYVECRHVKPIKGDKIGRVTYHHAREILIAL